MTRRSGWVTGIRLLVLLLALLLAAACHGSGESGPQHLYVDGAAEPGGVGTEGSPFSSIGDALLAASDSDAAVVTVHIRPGVYVESLRLDRDGLTLTADPASSEDPVVLRPTREDYVVLVAEEEGREQTRVTLEGISVEDGTTIGVRVTGANLEMQSSSILRTVKSSDALLGHGLYADSGAIVSLTNCDIENNAAAGILCDHSTLTVNDGNIRYNEGGGLWLQSCPMFSILGPIVEANKTVGIAVLSSTGEIISAQILSTEQMNYVPGPVDQLLGDGILVQSRYDDNGELVGSPSDVQILSNEIIGSQRAGITVSDGAEGTIEDNVINDNTMAGLWVQQDPGSPQGAPSEGTPLEVILNDCRGNRLVSIGTYGPVHVIVERNEIGMTEEQYDWTQEAEKIGDGLGISVGGIVEASANRLYRSDRYDLIMTDPGDGTKFDGTNETTESGDTKHLFLIQLFTPELSSLIDETQLQGWAQIDKAKTNEIAAFLDLFLAIGPEGDPPEE